MTIPTLIFDLGGVLVDIQYQRFSEALGLGQSYDESALLRLLAPDAQLYEGGKISTQEFFLQLQEHLGGHYSEDQLREAWRAILAGEVAGMRELIHGLSRQYPLYLLSNTNELHFEHAKEKFAILRMLTQHFVSYKIGAMKPSPDIYNHVIRTLGRDPSTLLFIDDVPRNVAGARKAGMHSLLFAGAEALKGRLRTIGFAIE